MPGNQRTFRKSRPSLQLSFELPEIEYLTMDQQQSVLDHIPPRDRPIFEFMMEYGVRPGEARAFKGTRSRAVWWRLKDRSQGTKLRETTKTGRVRMFELTGYIKASSTACSRPFRLLYSPGQRTTYRTPERILTRSGRPPAIKPGSGSSSTMRAGIPWGANCSTRARTWTP